MPVPKPKYPIELTDEEEQELRKLANSHNALHVREGSSGPNSAGR